MGMNGELPGTDTATLEGRVLRLERQYEDGQKEYGLLSKNVELLSHEVKKLCLAIGITHHVPVPEDWQEITQVRRPVLKKLERSRNRSKWIAIGSGFATGLFEIVRYVMEHYHGTWH